MLFSHSHSLLHYRTQNFVEGFLHVSDSPVFVAPAQGLFLECVAAVVTGICIPGSHEMRL